MRGPMNEMVASHAAETAWAPGPGKTFELLLITAHRLAVAMHATLFLDEMSTMELVALRILSRARVPPNVKALAAELGCTRPSTTQIVDRLSRGGYAERVVDDNDRRARFVVPTNKGLNAAKLAADAIDHCMSSFTRSFTVQERTTLLILLERLERGADWHRTEQLWNMHGFPHAVPRGRPSIHVR